MSRELDQYLADPVGSFWQGLKPNPIFGIREYAEKHMVLGLETPFPGVVDFSRTPYLIQILEDLEEDNGVEEVILQKGWQVGGTLTMLAWALHSAAVSPCPMMIVQPKEWLADQFSKKRLSPIFAACNDLQGKVSSMERREMDTLDTKIYPGGFTIVANAGSPTNLRSFSIKKLGFDEVSDYPEDCQGQGDPCRLALGRTSAFEGRKKIFYLSTPTIQGRCRIERAYEGTQKYKYFVPCPSCGTFQTIEWENLTWEEGDPYSVRLKCIGCDKKLRESDKTDLLANGEWRATEADTSRGRRKGYHLSALYSPVGMYSWASAVEQYLLGKKEPSEMKVFTNNILAETWEESQSEEFDVTDLRNLAEDYSKDPLPEGLGLLVAGVDVHPTHVDILVKGFGRGQESWVIDWYEIDGDANMKSTWDRVYRILTKEYVHASGITIPISATCIDTGGHNTQAVYDFVRPLFRENIIGIKGIGTPNYPTIGRPSRPDERGAIIYPVGSHTTKQRVWRRLHQSFTLLARLNTPDDTEVQRYAGPGICHFHKDLPDSFFRQMTATRQVRKRINGTVRSVIETPEGHPDHAFDCYRYADAALYWLKIDLDRHCEDLEGGDIFSDPPERMTRDII